MLVDLHTHSFYSDGTLSPEEIINEAKEKGVQVISITDHNVLEAYNNFNIDDNEIRIIKGVEIDSKFEDNVLHLLAYNFENTEKLIKVIDTAREMLLKTSEVLIERMSKDYKEISTEDYNNYNYDRTKGGWKGIHYLLNKKITTDLFEGMKYYSEYKCTHIEFDFPRVKEVCDAVHEAGGYVVLAHPCNYYKNLNKEELLVKLEALKGLGIDGVESFYPANSELMTETCVEFCEKNNLIITAGSDGHGDFGAVSKGVEYYIGAVKVKEGQLKIEKLLK